MAQICKVKPNVENVSQWCADLANAETVVERHVSISILIVGILTWRDMLGLDGKCVGRSLEEMRHGAADERRQVRDLMPRGLDCRRRVR